MQAWAIRTKVWTKPLCLPMRRTICASNLAASDVMWFRLDMKAQKRTAILTSCAVQIREFICFIAFLNWTPGDNIEFQKERIERLKQEVVSCHTTASLLCRRNLRFVTPSHTFAWFSSVLSETILQAAAEEQRVQEMQAHSSAHAFNPRVLFDWRPWAGHTFYIFPLAGATKESGRETWPGLLDSDLGCDVIWSLLRDPESETYPNAPEI